MSKNLRKFLQKYDGLSTLNYETIYDDFTSNDAVGIAGFEIRPFKPMKQEVFINNENIYKQRFKDPWWFRAFADFHVRAGFFR